MKKVIILVLALGVFSISQGQSLSKETSTRIETKRVGDSTITTKVITTTIDGKTTTEKEVAVQRHVKVAEATLTKKKRGRAIMGISFVGSFLNDNNALNTKLEMRDINDFNFGALLQIGGATPFGLEMVFDIGIEGSENKSNNKQLDVISTFISFNLGYPAIKLKNEKFMIVPRVGIGVNLNDFNYVKTSDNDITMDLIAGNAWSISQRNNFYIPLGLEFRIGGPETYFVIAGEYRYTFYNSNAYLSSSKQKVSDFPDVGLNKVGIRIGFVGMF